MLKNVRNFFHSPKKTVEDKFLKNFHIVSFIFFFILAI